jgi:hypothetical protein
LAGLELVVGRTSGTELTVQCPAGKAALSAGFSTADVGSGGASGVSATMSLGGVLIEFLPVLGGGAKPSSGDVPTAWRLKSPSFLELEVYLFCYVPGQ